MYGQYDTRIRSKLLSLGIQGELAATSSGLNGAEIGAGFRGHLFRLWRQPMLHMPTASARQHTGLPPVKSGEQF
jgi:hypothetical protein